MTSELVVGALLVFGVLWLVLFPLVWPRRVHHGGRAVKAEESTPTAIEILREIEFDRATGKLSDADYGSLKSSYTGAALAELRGAAATAPVATAIPAEAAVCPVCGPRPEPDAQYCSNCAQYLPGVCRACGVSVTQPAARFCTGCGAGLWAE
jgi:hypothetical protein